MPKTTTKYRMTGPGRILDRSVKKGKLVVTLDVSPDNFVSECRKEKSRLKLVISGVAVATPIEIFVEPQTWKMQFEKAAIPKARLADLERLITEESDVQIAVEYTPEPRLGYEAEGAE